MKFHDTLNEKLFNIDTMEMLPEVKEKLKEIAEAFIEFLEIPTDAVLDKVITGSSASYNYNKYSDLDLHIIVDYDKVHEDCPLVNGYLNSLKKQFNDNHDITIHGVPVELYAEQKDQGTVHNGLYSLQTGWIDKPQKIEPTDNDVAVEAKFNEIKELVDKCDDSEQAQELLEKIYNMRKAGLAEAGEFCTENLAFKKLRNEGCMDKLRQIKKEQIDKQLSLESYNEAVDSIVIDNYLKMLLDGGHVVDTSDSQYIVQVFTNKKLQKLVEFDDIRKAAETFIEFTDIYTKDEDLVLFKQMKENGKDIKTIDSTWLNVKNKNESIKELSLESYKEEQNVEILTPEDKEYLTKILSKDYSEDSVKYQIQNIEDMLKNYVWTKYDRGHDTISNAEECQKEYGRKRMLRYIANANWGHGLTSGKSLGNFTIHAPNTYLPNVVDSNLKNKNESIKEEDMDKLEKTLNEAEGIYKPSLIYGAYKLEQQWLKGQELEDGQAPEVMLFIINDPEEGIEDTKFVNKKDIYTYQPKENEFYLDMVRDSGDVITDYNLEPTQKLVDLWNKYKETNMKEEFDVEPVYYYCVEDIDQRGDRFDNAEEAYEQAKEDLTKLGYEVKELNDDAEFDVYSSSTGVAYPGVIYTTSPEIDEDVATLIDKVDSAENDLQDIISALETTMTEALEENILQGINEEYETFTVDGVDFSIQNRNDGKVQITQNRPYSMQDWSYAIGTLEEREGKGKWFGKYSLYRNGQFQYPVVTDEKEEVAKWLLRKDKDLEYLPDRT